MNAWTQLTDKHEERKIWDKFNVTFSFNPNIKGPAIKAPTPSLTFDLMPFHNQGLSNSVSDPLVNDFHAFAFRCLRKSIPGGDFFYVLNFSSATYKFYPHAEGFDPKDINAWEMPILPVKGKYAHAPFECYAFWNPSHSAGIFVDMCMEMTIFGEGLLEEMNRQRINPLIRKIKRRNGKLVIKDE